MGDILQGKVAAVTGAGHGSRRGVAAEFAGEGAGMVEALRSQGGIGSAIDEIRAERAVIGVLCAVAVIGDAKQTVFQKQFGHIGSPASDAQSFGTAEKLAVNPALAGSTTSGTASGGRTFATAPTATCQFMKAAIPSLKASDAGRIINFGRHWGQIGYAGAATKLVRRTVSWRSQPSDADASSIPRGGSRNGSFRSTGNQIRPHHT